MRSSLIHRVQIISRSSLPPKTKFIPPLPVIAKAAAENPKPSVVDILMKRKEQEETASSSTSTVGNWPPNLRIEPVIKKADLKNVREEFRPRLKRLMKEA
ncbi:hypothetical protein BDP27DRAFT_1452483 [Rhodocollybia butyracea]|uniref:Uncharacterized protein n=1 Tax=Rhodocollybia butyracea TaxID=206335 RepID=A0A9P5U048_9AGAR|nr:hypothetical protein BDP27DRAFT_1452483 [Rhodocollybia butyracea]